jgi:hypothetical protein
MWRLHLDTNEWQLVHDALPEQGAPHPRSLHAATLISTPRQSRKVGFICF